MPEFRFAINSLEQEKIPTDVMVWFEGRSAVLISPKDYRPGNFMAFYVINHETDATYIARQIKIYPVDGLTEDLVHLIDIDSVGGEEGHSELRYNTSDGIPYFKNKPFVGYTTTRVDLRNKGLGTRRLLMMNDLAVMLYGFPLHSSTLISDEAKRLWEKLVAEKKAVKFNEEGRERYKFI